MVNELWKDNKDSVRCALAPPTGLAAFNIDGVTVHRLFQLPIEHNYKTSSYWPLPKKSLKMIRNNLKHLKLIIIDEVSMLSSLCLAYIHLRLEEVFVSDQWFGAINVLFVGDIQYLQQSNCRTARLMTSVNIWSKTVVYDELTINERQKRDPERGHLLN